MTPVVLVPASADEAATMYGDGDGITVFAGGTILLPEIAAGRLVPERALMLHRTGLGGGRVGGARGVIGAMVSVAALADGPDELLASCARHVADGEVRRNATVGGNISSRPRDDSQRGGLGGALIA